MEEKLEANNGRNDLITPSSPGTELMSSANRCSIIRVMPVMCKGSPGPTELPDCRQKRLSTVPAFLPLYIIRRKGGGARGAHMGWRAKTSESAAVNRSGRQRANSIQPQIDHRKTHLIGRYRATPALSRLRIPADHNVTAKIHIL